MRPGAIKVLTTNQPDTSRVIRTYLPPGSFRSLAELGAEAVCQRTDQALVHRVHFRSRAVMTRASCRISPSS